MKTENPSGWNDISLFPEGPSLSDVVPASCCNLCHHFFLTSLFPPPPSIPPLLCLLCFTSTLQTDRPFTLSSSVFSPPSILGHVFTTYLCHVCLYWSNDGEMSEHAPPKDLTGNRRRRCLDAVCSRGTGKASPRVWTRRGWAASGGMTRGGRVWEERPAATLQHWWWPWAL